MQNRMPCERPPEPFAGGTIDRGVRIGLPPDADSGFRVTVQNRRRNAGPEGRCGSVQLHKGLMLHFLDAVSYDYDLLTSMKQKEGLSLQFFLPAPARTALPDMDGANGDSGLPRALMMACVRPELFECRGRQRGHLRKISIMLSPDWLKESGVMATLGHFDLKDFAATHLARHSWTPGPRLRTLAEAILSTAPRAEACHKLYLESRVLELLAETFSSLTGGPSDAAQAEDAASPRDVRRMRMIDDRLALAERRPLSLDDLAGAVQLSRSSLQRLFKTFHGVSAFEYLRRRNLELARAALDGQGLSVKEAAYLAGYTSAANFSTAYRRHFGESPSRTGR